MQSPSRSSFIQVMEEKPCEGPEEDQEESLASRRQDGQEQNQTWGKHVKL